MSAAVVHGLSPFRIPLDGSLPPPTLQARSAMVIEARTGVILFEDRADTPVPPASLTKLMTLHIALNEIAAGRLDPAEHIVPGPDAWARNMPPRSSVMFLGPRQRLTVGQLLQGLVVVSGNDAAVALADRIAGSVPGFVGMMNNEAARLGYREMHFVDPSGISSSNTITAREYASSNSVSALLMVPVGPACFACSGASPSGSGPCTSFIRFCIELSLCMV